MTMSAFDRRRLLELSGGLALTTLAGCTELFDASGPGEEFETDDDEDVFTYETVTDGLSHPWSITFVPESTFVLVTEREGTLYRIDRADGSSEAVDGTPEVYAAGQGGLLDSELHPAFPDEEWLYLTYAVENEDGSTTALGRGRLTDEATTLTDFEELHVAEPFVDDTGHFGSRVVFDEAGFLYMTTGDRQFKDFDEDHVSQDRTNELGATLRLEADGSIPEDNPFVDDDDVEDSIFTYGHRNVQGMTIHPETGAIWQSEHGEQDGDEINVLEEGGNYGWPITHYGCEYGSDEAVGEEPHERDDVVDPLYYWECNSGGFPPAGMTFYDGEAFPDWQGDLFVGNLAGQFLGRFTVEEADTDADDLEDDDRDIDIRVSAADALLADEGWRIRDVEMAPDTEYLYVIADESDAPLVRLVPEDES